MHVQLSGGVEVTIDASPVDLGSAKSKVVFAALALNAGMPVPTPRLIELVWGDDPPRSAEKTLQSYITRLRKSCGPTWIDRVGDAYRLTVDAEAVDLVRFERLLDEGDVVTALELWRGPALAGLPAPGLDPTLARVTERFLAATENDLGALVDGGQSADAIGRLRELVAEHPLRESLWGLLMRALYQADRQAEALRAYGEARDHLVDGLGIEPGAALQELEHRILAHDPDLLVSAQAAARAPEPDDRTFLFTDIADSTGLWARHPEAMATEVEAHDDTLRVAVVANGGEVFKHTGDGLLASFSTPDAAIRAAVGAQLDLRHWLVGGEALTVRMAISTGRTESRDGDWFGPALNIAARLLDGAHGGQILLAGASGDRLGIDLDQAITVSDLGQLSLRGLSRPERVRQVLHPALPRRFPPLRTLLRRDESEDPDFPPQLEYRESLALVGREEQMALVGAAWDRVQADHRPELVLLAGEPGVGKTRLAAAAARVIHDQDSAVVVYGRCAEDHPSPFRPFTMALTAYGNARSDDELRTEVGPHPELLIPVMPLVLDRFADVERKPVGDVAAQLDVFDAVGAFLEVASSSPLVVVLDDIHWADRASLDLLRHLVRNLTAGRLLLVATYRDVEVDRSHPLARVLADLRREERVQRLPVRGIDADGSVALTEAMFGHELSEVGRELAARAGADAGGNPFFLQEMLRHFMESGVLVRRQGRWTADDATTVEESVPEGIREVVGRRLDQVSDDCNALLSIASALVDDIDLDVLVTVSDTDEDAALDLLDEALEAGLLVDATRPDHYEFSHALVRQTLYREFSTARRLRLHRRIAAALVASGRTDDTAVSTIAHHYLAGASTSDPAALTRWTRAAAAIAVERYAFEEAAELLARALDTTEGRLDASTYFLLLGDLCTAKLRLNAPDEATELLASLVDLAATEAPELIATVAIAISRAVGVSMQLGPALRHLLKLFESTDRAHLEPALATAMAVERLARAAGPVDTDMLMRHLNEMDDETLPRAMVEILLQTVMTQRQYPQFRDQALRLATRRPSPAMRSTVDFVRTFVDMVTWQEVAYGRPETRRARGRLEALEQVLPMGRAIRLGDASEFEAVVERIDPVAPPLLMEYARRWFAYESGVDVSGRPPIGQSLGIPGGSDYVHMPHARTDQLDPEAIRSFAAGRAPGLTNLLLVCQLVAEANLVDLAETLWQQIQPAQGLAGPLFGGFYVVAVDYHLGLLADMLGRHDDSIELHVSALARSQAAGIALDVAYTTEELVRLLGRRNEPGDTELAREHAAAAVEMLDRTPYERRKRMLDEALAALPE